DNTKWQSKQRAALVVAIRDNSQRGEGRFASSERQTLDGTSPPILVQTRAPTRCRIATETKAFGTSCRAVVLRTMGTTLRSLTTRPNSEGFLASTLGTVLSRRIPALGSCFPFWVFTERPQARILPARQRFQPEQFSYTRPTHRWSSLVGRARPRAPSQSPEE